MAQNGNASDGASLRHDTGGMKEVNGVEVDGGKASARMSRPDNLQTNGPVTHLPQQPVNHIPYHGSGPAGLEANCQPPPSHVIPVDPNYVLVHAPPGSYMPYGMSPDQPELGYIYPSMPGSPTLPMLPPTGYFVAQVLDENGQITHILCNPQPPDGCAGPQLSGPTSPINPPTSTHAVNSLPGQYNSISRSAQSPPQLTNQPIMQNRVNIPTSSRPDVAESSSTMHGSYYTPSAMHPARPTMHPAPVGPFMLPTPPNCAAPLPGMMPQQAHFQQQQQQQQQQPRPPAMSVPDSQVPHVNAQPTPQQTQPASCMMPTSLPTRQQPGVAPSPSSASHTGSIGSSTSALHKPSSPSSSVTSSTSKHRVGKRESKQRGPASANVGSDASGPTAASSSKSTRTRVTTMASLVQLLSKIDMPVASDVGSSFVRVKFKELPVIEGHHIDTSQLRYQLWIKINNQADGRHTKNSSAPAADTGLPEGFFVVHQGPEKEVTVEGLTANTTYTICLRCGGVTVLPAFDSPSKRQANAQRSVPLPANHTNSASDVEVVWGAPTDMVNVQTRPGVPSAPGAPVLHSRTRSMLHIKWSPPKSDHGSPIKHYIVESVALKDRQTEAEAPSRDSPLWTTALTVDVNYAKLTKLQPGTTYAIRVKVVNQIGVSRVSETLVCATAESAPSPPEPPMLDVAAGGAACDALALCWKRRQPGDHSFVLQYMDDKSGHGFQPAYTGEATRYTMRPLQVASEYHWRLAAVSEDDLQSPWSARVTFKTLATRPSLPRQVKQKNRATANSFVVTWEPPDEDGGSPVTEYIVEVTDQDSDSNAYTTTTAATQVTVAGRQPGRSYCVLVYARSGAGTSLPSRPLQITTAAVVPGRCEPPIVESASASQLTIVWGAPSENGGNPLTRYDLGLMGDDAVNGEAVSQASHPIISYSGPDMRHSVGGLRPGKEYAFSVRAGNSLGVGAWSPVAMLRTRPAAPDAPLSLRVHALSSTTVRLAWQNADNNGAPITHHVVQMVHCALGAADVTNDSCFGGSDDIELCTTTTAAPTATASAVVPPLSPMHGTTEGRVGADGSRGHSPAASCDDLSSVSSRSPPPSNPPPATSYQTCLSCANWSLTYVEVNCLAPDSAYWFRVGACNETGCGPFSQPAFVTTLPSVPQPPELTLTAVGSDRLLARWSQAPSAPTSSIPLTAVTTYTLVVQGGDYSGEEPLTVTVPAPTCEHTIAGLKPYTNYCAKIQATSAVGQGPFSSPVKATTFAGCPDPPNMQIVGEPGHSWARVKLQSSNVVEAQHITVLGAFEDDSTHARTLWVGRVEPGQAHTAKLKNLQPNTTYLLSCQARNEAGVSAKSLPVMLQTRHCPMPKAKAPTIVDIRATSARADWSLASTSPSQSSSSTSRSQQQCRLQVSTMRDSHWTDVACDTRPALISDLSPSTTYFVRFRPSSDAPWSHHAQFRTTSQGGGGHPTSNGHLSSRRNSGDVDGALSTQTATTASSTRGHASSISISTRVWSSIRRNLSGGHPPTPANIVAHLRFRASRLSDDQLSMLIIGVFGLFVMACFMLFAYYVQASSVGVMNADNGVVQRPEVDVNVVDAQEPMPPQQPKSQ